MKKWFAMGLLCAGMACGGTSVVDGTQGGQGGGADEGCPNELVGDGTPCSDVGLECAGEGSDDLCFDWTCSCQNDGTFRCDPGACA